jgi:hypothetical protein
MIATLVLAGSVSMAQAYPSSLRSYSAGSHPRIAENRKAWSHYEWSRYNNRPAVRPLYKPRYYVRPSPQR